MRFYFSRGSVTSENRLE